VSSLTAILLRARAASKWAITSLLILVVCAMIVTVESSLGVLWISPRRDMNEPPRYCALWLSDGGVSYSWTELTDQDVEKAGTLGPWWRAYRRAHPWAWAPEWFLSPLSNSYRLPLWMPFGLLAAVTLTGWWPNIRRVHRRRRGLCLHCGYDLRQRTGTRCPECGLE